MTAFSIAGALLLMFLVFLFVTRNTDIYQARDEGEIRRIQDYSLEEIEDKDAPAGVAEVYRFTLDRSVIHDSCLAFYTVHQYVEVYLDDECVYSLNHADTLPMIKTVGSNWIRIPVYREDAGKEVRVVVRPAYESFRNRKIEFLTGSGLAIYVDRLKKDIPQLIISGIIIFTGLIFAGVALYTMFTSKRGGAYLMFGLTEILLGLWRLTDTRFSPYMLSDKPVFLFYISISAMMIGMIPLMIYHKKKIRGRMLDYYCVGASFICIIQLQLQVFGIMDFREMITVPYCVILAGVLIILVNLLMERLRNPDAFKRNSFRVVFWMLVGGISADAVTFYVQKNSSVLLFTLLAFLCIAVFTGISVIFDYVRQEKLLKDKEEEFINSRITASMGQIRTHFIFNILNAISGMCKYDPEKADETIIRFSRYLRTNIDLMQEEKLIDFSSELKYIEDYIELERIRYGDKIRFLAAIGVSDFMIPPLVLQPIIENSVRHGLLPKSSGGTIMLRTWIDGDYIRIAVSDDGVGFNTGASGYKDSVDDNHSMDDNHPLNDNKSSDEKKSVGLNNIRFRLQYMVQGKLDIESVPGSGTTVTVSIPHREG